MAGHSHWAQIKRKKGANDKKRGKLFSRLAKAITLAAKNGGGDPDGNLRLRYAIDEARRSNMPKDSIESALRKGTGEDGNADDLEELIYGGYGQNGVAILCEIVTDNRNRTAPEVKKIFERRGGKFDDSGSTVYKFEQKGVITVSRETIGEEALMDVAVEAGADDIITEDPEYFEIRVEPGDYMAVLKALEEHDPPVPVAESGIQRLPMVEIDLDEETARKVMGLMNDLDDHDDVNAIYTDAGFPEGFEG